MCQLPRINTPGPTCSPSPTLLPGLRPGPQASGCIPSYFSHARPSTPPQRGPDHNFCQPSPAYCSLHSSVAPNCPLQVPFPRHLQPIAMGACLPCSHRSPNFCQLCSPPLRISSPGAICCRPAALHSRNLFAAPPQAHGAIHSHLLPALQRVSVQLQPHGHLPWHPRTPLCACATAVPSAASPTDTQSLPVHLQPQRHRMPVPVSPLHSAAARDLQSTSFVAVFVHLQPRVICSQSCGASLQYQSLQPLSPCTKSPSTSCGQPCSPSLQQQP